MLCNRGHIVELSHGAYQLYSHDINDNKFVHFFKDFSLKYEIFSLKLKLWPYFEYLCPKMLETRTKKLQETSESNLKSLNIFI